MTPLDAALRYMSRLGPVFACGPDKTPLIKDWPNRASLDARQIAEWWRRWPQALIAMPTGERTNLCVLDIDVKNGVDGLATYATLDCPIMPVTPTVITRSGGQHLYFARPFGGFRNTTGARGRGVGAGLDWRADSGFVILPSPGSGYRWGRWHFGNCDPIPIPCGLRPREPERVASTHPVKPTRVLSPYAESALDDACRRIIAAPAGEQETTLNGESFSIGTLAGAGVMPVDFARRVLVWAARQMRDYDHRRPWRAEEIETKVARAFSDGVRHPREARHAAV
jgi:hypothetical protein